jgi:hypothetical protein
MSRRSDYDVEAGEPQRKRMECQVSDKIHFFQLPDAHTTQLKVGLTVPCATLMINTLRNPIQPCLDSLPPEEFLRNGTGRKSAMIS